jgi:serine/threonine-protein kinase
MPRQQQNGRPVLGGFLLAVLTAALPLPGLHAREPTPGELAARVKEIFRSRCLECHGGSKTNAGVKILDHALLVKGKKKVIPGRPDASPLFRLITSRDGSMMPPEGQPRLSPADVTAVRRWIRADAPPFPKDVAPPPEKDRDPKLKGVVGVAHVLNSILADVRRLPPEERPHQRYFSFNHLLTRGATREELDLHRDALAKAVNHLSWERRLVRPRPIDPGTNTIFAVDIGRLGLGWDRQPFQRIRDGKAVGRSKLNLFDLVLLEYPYGTVYQDSDTLDRLAEEYLIPAGLVRPIPYVRADWFVSVATQPPLYEDLLRLPRDLKELETLLGVDAGANLRRDVVRRAGLAVSGVSHSNRVLERHPARYGAYWKSFDFRSSKGRDNIFQDPIRLQPAGGEVVFNLPNGLQGYFLADGRGRRLASAPTDIVTDRFAEDRTIRNGLACMRCHDRGLKGFTDAMRPAVQRLSDSSGLDRRRLLRLYPPQAELDKLLGQDEERFLGALHDALDKPPVGEPLVPVTRRFLEAPLPLSAAAAELGLASPEGLRSVFRLPRFAALGLLPLASDGVVRRDTWEDCYPQTVRHLGLGTPVVPLDGLTRRDVGHGPLAADLHLQTNKPNNLFASGDKMVILVVNRSHQDLSIELIGTSVWGRKVILAPAGTVVKAGREYRYPPTGFIRIRGGAGKEQVTLLAGTTPFPAGELLRGQGVSDRVVHSFYALRKDGKRLRLTFDPARLVKKTIEIETR